jgi:hypothetical protein
MPLFSCPVTRKMPTGPDAIGIGFPLVVYRDRPAERRAGMRWHTVVEWEELPSPQCQTEEIITMEAPDIAFTPDQVAERGMDNWQHVLFGTIAYLKARGLSVEDWATFLGAQFAPGWGRGYTANDFMRQAALNVVSAGASPRSLTGTDDWAECVVGDWPPQGKLASERFNHWFGLSQADVDSFWEVFRPIAAYLGFDYDWYRESDTMLSFTFSRET